MSFRGSISTVKEILSGDSEEIKFNINARGEKGETPFWIAVFEYDEDRSNDLELIILLLNCGADPHVDINGNNQ